MRYVIMYSVKNESTNVKADRFRCRGCTKETGGNEE